VVKHSRDLGARLIGPERRASWAWRTGDHTVSDGTRTLAT